MFQENITQRLQAMSDKNLFILLVTSFVATIGSAILINHLYCSYVGCFCPTPISSEMYNSAGKSCKNSAIADGHTGASSKHCHCYQYNP